MASRKTKLTSVPTFEETGLPESYRSEYLANPWAGKTATGGFLGIGKRQQQLQMQTNADQYVADLMARQHKEDYEDPLSSSSRLRAAGINPDLAGLDGAGVAGDAPGASQFPELDAAGQASSVANTMLSIISMFTGVPAAIADLTGKMIDNRSALVEQVMGVASLVDDDASALRPLVELPDDASLPNLLAAASSVAGRSEELGKVLFPHDKRMRQMFTDLYPKRQNSLRNQLARFENLRDMINVETSAELNDAETLRAMSVLYSRYQLESLRNKKIYEDALAEFYAEHPNFAPDLVKAQQEASLAEAHNDSARADYDTGLVEKLDVQKQANAINQGNAADALQAIEQQYRSRQNATDLKIIEETMKYFEDPGAYNTDQWYKDKGKGTLLKHKFSDEWKMAREKRKYQRAYERQYGKRSGGLKLSVPGVGSVDYRK